MKETKVGEFVTIAGKDYITIFSNHGNCNGCALDDCKDLDCQPILCAAYERNNDSYDIQYLEAFSFENLTDKVRKVESHADCLGCLRDTGRGFQALIVSPRKFNGFRKWDGGSITFIESEIREHFQMKAFLPGTGLNIFVCDTFEDDVAYFVGSLGAIKMDLVKNND